MPNGNSRPRIDQQSVRAALEEMIYTSRLAPPNPLEQLLLVDQQLSRPDVPHLGEPRLFALRHLLTDIISREYETLRVKLGLEGSIPPPSAETAHEAIRKDVQTRNPELFGWSLLYYRFVQVHLNFTPEILSELTGFDERSLRRYQRHGIRRLTERLADAEWSVRRLQRRLRLTAGLPIVAHTRLLGREDHFRQVEQVLGAYPPYHIQVTGTAGSGKSAFVRECVRRLIDQDALDQVIWIDDPPSPEYVRQLLSEHLWSASAPIGLKQYTLENRLCVVLNHTERWKDEPGFHNLLADLSGAVVYMTSGVSQLFLTDCCHIVLEELREADALALARISLGTGIDEEAAEDYSRQIWNSVGGNPLAIKLAARHAALYDPAVVTGNILQRLFDRTYDLLDAFAHATWIMLAMIPPGWSLDHPALVGQGNQVLTLLQYHLAEFDSQTRTGFIPTVSQRYIQQRCDRSPETRAALDSLLERLDSASDDSCFDVVEHILFTGWPLLSVDRYRRWTSRFVAEGIRRGHFARWLTITQRCEQQTQVLDFDVELAQAVCLRQLAEWPKAEQKMIRLVEETGAKASFVEQGRALLELGILLRLRGQYEQAERMFDRVSRTAVRYANDDLLNVVRLEHAQLAIERGDGQTANTLLQDAPLSSRVLALKAEANLLSGNLQSAFEQIQRALTLAEGNRRTVGRLYVLMGRLYERQNDFDSAQDFLNQAVTILEQEDDFAGLARANANLGSVFIQLHRYREANDVLIQAEKMLLWLGDRVALLAVRHNLNVLRRFAG